MYYATKIIQYVFFTYSLDFDA